MTTPALTRLREALPHTRITLVSPAKLVDLWSHHPAVDEVIGIASGESPWAIGRRLRPLRCDAALVLPNSPRSALECWAARIPRRIGYSRPWRNLFLTVRVPSRPGAVPMHKPSVAEIRHRLEVRSPNDPSLPTSTAHHCHDYLALAAVLGARPDPVPPMLAVTPAEIGAIRAKFDLSDRVSWLALNPGAEYGPAKRWPPDRFAEAARSVQDSSALRWVVVGGPNDGATAVEIAGRLTGAVNVAGRTSLRELMAVLSLSRLLLTNDTGPMHVGAALGIPVVVPFGSTSPELTGPGLPGDQRHRLLRAGAPCAPCFLRQCPIDFRCMTGITVDAVCRAVREVLDVAP